MNINVADYKSQIVSQFYVGIRKASSCSPDAAASSVFRGRINHCLWWFWLLPKSPLPPTPSLLWQTAGNICFVPLDDLMVTFRLQETCFPLTVMHRNKREAIFLRTLGKISESSKYCVVMSWIKSSTISGGTSESRLEGKLDRVLTGIVLFLNAL